MQIKPDRRPVLPVEEGEIQGGYVVSADKAVAMRKDILKLIEGLQANTVLVRQPHQPKELDTQGEGHFHLAPEMFFQTGGTTRFIFPHEELDLKPGQVLIVPARLVHAERVLPNTQEERFSNTVIYAHDMGLICHLGHGLAEEMPRVYHLEARHHKLSPRIHDWLVDAAKIAWDMDAQAGITFQGKERLRAIQVHSLVTAACAGALEAIDDAELNANLEPALISQVRVCVKKRIGDHGLSVSLLAAEAGCTTAYLSHLFSQATGEHLVTYINRERMQRAASLLAETKMAGKEVAWACGFSRSSYFIQMFRAHYGTTPKHWRTKRKDDLGEIATDAA